MEYPHCAICLKTIESDGVVLTSKGIDGVNRASKARGETVSVAQGDSVHKECRQNYTRPSNIAKYVRQSEEAGQARRNIRPRRKLPLDFKKDCLLCGTEIDKEQERKRARVVCTVRTMDMQQTILNECETRGDEWAEMVRARIQSVHDLPAADAVYHHSCSTNFRTKMNIPGSFISDQPEKKKMKTGEENDGEQVTVSDLTEKMQGFLEESAVGMAYSARHMKERLMEHFGENVIITSKPGKTNIVTFRRTVASTLRPRIICRSIFWQCNMQFQTEVNEISLVVSPHSY